MYTIIILAVYLMWVPTVSKECLTEPVKGTDENKAKRNEIIKSIRVIRNKLKKRGDTLKAFNGVQSLEFLNAYKNKLQKQLDAAAPASTASPTTNENKCQKLAAKSVWRRFDFKTRLAKNNKCPSGWEATGCGSGMGEFSNKQCRRGKTKVRSELIKSIDANRAELIKRGVNVVKSGDGTKRKMIKNRNLLKARAEAIQKNLDLYNTTGATPGDYKPIEVNMTPFKIINPNLNQNATAPEEDDSTYAPSYMKSVESMPCFLGYYVDRGGISEEIQHKQCTAKDLRGLNVSKVLVQNGIAVIRVLDEIFSADGSGPKTKDVAVKGMPGNPGKFFGTNSNPILEIVSFTGN